MAWVLNHSTTSGTDRLVLLGIANHADEYGENAWPSVPTLARYAGVGERATRYALRNLEDAGHIITEGRKGGRVDSDPRYRTNRYTVVGVRESRGAQGFPSGQSRGAPAFRQGGTSVPSGGHGGAGKPSYNRPEPPAGFDLKIDKALTIAARTSKVKILDLRKRHTDDLVRFCTTWPAISADQLAAYMVDGVLPQSVSCLERVA